MPMKDRSLWLALETPGTVRAIFVDCESAGCQHHRIG
jgi:hypothetical protein